MSDARENIEKADSPLPGSGILVHAVRAMLLIGAIVAAGAIVLGFTVFGGTSSGSSKPSLHVIDRVPLTVRGAHFQRAERVRLTAGKAAAAAKAGGDGTFVITIQGADRCSSTRVLARGSAGSYVVVKLLPAPACAAARSG
jgi:hypothetical protein